MLTLTQVWFGVEIFFTTYVLGLVLKGLEWDCQLTTGMQESKESHFDY